MERQEHFTSRLCLRVAAALVVLGSGGAASAQWTAGPSMDVPRNLFGAAVGHQGRVYAFGGACCGGPGGGSVFLSSTSVLLNGSWSAGPDLSMPRFGVGAASVNGFIYAVGGVNSPSAGVFLASVERLDSTTPGASWETGRVADLPEPRAYAAVAADRLGRIWVIGGSSGAGAGQGESALVFVFDPARANLGWQSGPSLNTARRHAEAVTLADGRIAVIGGTTVGGVSVSSIEVVDPLAASPSWQFGTSIPGGQASSTANVGLGADGAVYYAGGWLPGYTTATLRYSFRSGQWAMVSSLQTPRNNFRLVTLSDGRMLAMGGDSGAVQVSSVEVLNTNPCPGDLTDDMVIDFNDFLEYLNRFNAGCP